MSGSIPLHKLMMGLFVACIIIIGVVVHIGALQKSQTLSLPPTNIVPTPTPPPLPQGKQTYFVSGKAEQGKPVLTEVVYDPFDPKPGQRQTILVKTKAKPAVDTVSVLMITDSKERKYEFKKTNDQGDVVTWEGSWEITDTHVNQYRAMVIGENQAGKTKIAMTLR